MQVLRAEHLSVRLPSAMEKSPIRQYGQPRNYEGNGVVQEITRSIRVFGIKEIGDYVVVWMVGQRWRGRRPHTCWHVTVVEYHGVHCASKYCYDIPQASTIRFGKVGRTSETCAR
jgi:hypothetical protein